jgi:hypothetical protein
MDLEKIKQMVEQAGGVFYAVQSCPAELGGDIILFTDERNARATLSLYASAIKSVEDIRKHIAWKRTQFGVDEEWEKENWGAVRERFTVQKKGR